MRNENENRLTHINYAFKCYKWLYFSHNLVHIGYRQVNVGYALYFNKTDVYTTLNLGYSHLHQYLRYTVIYFVLYDPKNMDFLNHRNAQVTVNELPVKS